MTVLKLENQLAEITFHNSLDIEKLNQLLVQISFDYPYLSNVCHMASISMQMYVESELIDEEILLNDIESDLLQIIEAIRKIEQ
tara:strand:+ start:1648 stop:1899 length:252 start_codon:yes stop_codon:yes gene_type:complete